MHRRRTVHDGHWGGWSASPTSDPPLTVELLADLQAGLLDDDAAARVRKQVRTDPHAQDILRALNQVRRDVAAAGAMAPAPDAPPDRHRQNLGGAALGRSLGRS